MGFEDLTEFEILQSSLALVFVIISLFLGIRILLKYYSLKHVELLPVGLTWIFMSTPWWGPTISFLLIVFFGFELNQFLYLFIGTVFLPVALICWIYATCHLAYPRLKVRIVSIFLGICVIYEILLIFFLLVSPEIVGTMEGPVNSRHNLYTLCFDIFAIITSLIAGIILARILLKSESSAIKLKGIFLLLAFFSLTVGAILDAAITLNAITLVLVRILLMSSAIEYYMSFLLPSRISNWLENRNK